MKRGFLLVLFALWVSCLGCKQYQGDGTYSRYSSTQNSFYYQADFGVIDLTTKQTLVFHFSGIPSSKYWLCLRLGPMPLSWSQASFSHDLRAEIPSARAVVELTLKDEKGRVVTTCKGALFEDQWHWSGGRLGDFPAEGKGTAIHEINIFSGNPVFFELRKRERYTLTVSILTPAPEKSENPRLLLQGGFWK